MVEKTDSFERFKQAFHDEMKDIDDVNELKELYAREIARRDTIIQELQHQNDVILKTAFKQKQEEQKFK